MRDEIKYFIYTFVLGMSLVAYAHSTFSTKHEVRSNKEILTHLQSRIDAIYEHLIGE